MELERNEQVTLQQAIDRSRNHDEVVTLELDADAIEAAVEWISATYDGEMDSVTNGAITEVWGWSEEQANGDMDFRVHLRAVEGLAGE